MLISSHILFMWGFFIQYRDCFKATPQ